MNDVMQAFALIGAYFLGICTVLGLIAYSLAGDSKKNEDRDEMAMAEAVGVVKEAMPGSTILSYEINPS